MELRSHVVTVDTGLAPNPFHGYCTTALCTPSHCKAKLKPGDWLIGHSASADGHKLVYAMRVSEVLTMDAYFHDPRFQSKKPNPRGRIEDQCGDNLYYQNPSGHWKRLPSRFHNTCENFLADLKALGSNLLTGSPVFIASHFYYFGANRIDIPDRLSAIVKTGQGTKRTTGELVQAFVSWLASCDYKPGILGYPKDLADHPWDIGPMITDYLSDCEHTSATAVGDCKPRRDERNKPPNGCG